MKKLIIESSWKENWKYSYPYDLLEIYGAEKLDLGYAYAYQNRRDNTLALIESVAKENYKILDVAAAQGNFTLQLAELGYKVTWNDIRADLAEYVEMKREKGYIEYKPGNVFEVNFDSQFDIVLATEIIEHVAHPDDFLNSLSKLVRNNGYIVITTPLGSYFKNNLPKFTEFSDPSIFEEKQFQPNADGHIFLLHKDEIAQIANKAGLEVVYMKHYTNPLTNGHAKLDVILKYLPKKIVFYIEKVTQLLPDWAGNKIHNNLAVLLRKSTK